MHYSNDLTIESTRSSPRVDMETEQYTKFCQLLENRSGILLGPDKRYLVETRLSRVLRQFKIGSISTLIEQLLEGRDLALTKAVIDAMTTNETLWFRDTYPFVALRERFLPELASHNKRHARIWSAACSSGQEPYSISMIVSETKLPFSVEIVGTDLSTRILAQAETGLYDDLSLGRGLSEERKQKYFDHTEQGWKIKPEIRNRVTFKVANLLDPPPNLDHFDIVFCRNVLIYFSRDTKARIIDHIANSLQPGGVLILGASESTQTLSERFDLERIPGGGMIFRLKH